MTINMTTGLLTVQTILASESAAGDFILIDVRTLASQPDINSY